MGTVRTTVDDLVAAIAAGPDGPTIGAFFALEGAVLDTDGIAAAAPGWAEAVRAAEARVVEAGASAAGNAEKDDAGATDDAEEARAAERRARLDLVAGWAAAARLAEDEAAGAVDGGSGADGPTDDGGVRDVGDRDTGVQEDGRLDALAVGGHRPGVLAAAGRALLVDHLGGYLYPGAWELIEAHLRRGHTVVLCSALSATHVEPLADELGVEWVVATPPSGPVRVGVERAEAVASLASASGIDLAASTAYGHTAADAALLDRVGHAVVVDPEPGLVTRAVEAGWSELRWPHLGRPGPVEVVRTAATYGAVLTSAAAGITVGLARWNRRAGLNTWWSTLGDLTLAAAGIRLEVDGLEHLDAARPAVLVANHQSSLDLFVVVKLARRDLSGLAKKEMASAPVIGPAFRLAGVAFVDRGNHDQTREALRPAVDQLRAGTSLLVFPEGTRAPTPRLGPFKKGAFHLAMQAGVPIVPIVLRNPGSLMWRHDSTVRAGTIHVSVLEPVRTDGWTVESLDAHVADVRRQFLDVLGEAHLG